MTSLQSFDYLVLALIGQGGATTYEIEKVCRSEAGVMLGRSRSHLYGTPERLMSRNLVESVSEEGSTRARKRYRLTRAGSDALTAWMNTPTPPPAVDEEAVARLFTGDLVFDNVLLASLLAGRPLIEEKLDRLYELKRRAGRSFAHRYEKLAIQLKIDMLVAYEKWLDQAEKQLSPKLKRSRNR